MWTLDALTKLICSAPLPIYSLNKKLQVIMKESESGQFKRESYIAELRNSQEFSVNESVRC